MRRRWAALALAAAVVEAWPQPSALPQQGWWQSLGNHRFEIRIPVSAMPSDAFRVELPWRRADSNPEAKGSVLLDAMTGMPVAKCRRVSVNAAAGEYAFTGVPGGIYHLYYMPFKTCEFKGGACHSGQTDVVDAITQYMNFSDSCNDEPWWPQGQIAAATVSEYQARDIFDEYVPEEMIATPAEITPLMAQYGGLLMVVKDRGRPIRMLDRIPVTWVRRAQSPFSDLTSFSGRAQLGEAYSFQVAVAPEQPLTVTAAGLTSDMAGSRGAEMPQGALRCLNLEGRDYWGRNFTTSVNVSGGKVAVLWFVVDIPTTIRVGTYSGTLLVVTSRGQRSISLTFEIYGPALADHGYGEIWRGARLNWLDSTLGNNDDVPPPFTPLRANGRTVTLLDKVMTISTEGMLESVRVGGVEALAEPIHFQVLVNGRVAAVPLNLTIEQATRLSMSWKAEGAIANVTVVLSGSLDATGYADFEVTVHAKVEHEVRLVLPMHSGSALYGAGLGRPGGFLRRWFRFNSSSPPIVWRWDGVNGNNGLWIGSTRSGLRLFPKGDDPLWQAGVPYDTDQAPEAPESWNNGGQGGVAVWPNGTATAFTGLRPAGGCTFRFSVMATPVRPLDLPKHFSERYAQVSGPVNFTHLRAGGATVVNVHQGNALNPWINYPFLTNGLLKQAADECREQGMKLKVYNTMRELSNHARELWALRALNETLVWREGPEGGGGDWLREHLRAGYSVAWASPMASYGFWGEQIDMAVRIKAMSRWNNYYVEGIRQTVTDYGCEGIYLDEIAYDRVTMLRVKAVLGNGGLIDHHSDRGGFMKCPAVNYMELYPFIDSLWYGEGFNYDDATPDHWLVEISGLPFGLTSDMLRYEGMTPFHFRGMLFSSANRWQDNLAPGSSGPYDPRAIWGLWESFGIANSTMYGWWLAEEGLEVAVATNSSDVKCTAYVKPGRSLLVLANFGPAQVVSLAYNWKVLGLQPQSAASWQLRAPILQPMQPEAATWPAHDPIAVPSPVRGSSTSREGWLLLLEPSKPAALLYA